MGITLEIDGKRPQTVSYSIQADTASLDPSNTGAGVGGVSVSTPLHSSGLQDSWEFLNGKTLELKNPLNTHTYSIQNAELQGKSTLSISGESPLRPLQGTYRINPFNGSLAECVRWILQSVPTFTAEVIVSSPANPKISVPAYHGEVWPFFRDFLSANRLSVTVWDGNSVSIDSIGGLVRDTSLTSRSTTGIVESISGDQACEQVAVKWYKNDFLTNGTAYPVAGQDPNIISVNAGEVAVIELKTGMGLRSVNNPVPVDFLGAGYTGEGTMGSYTIAGNDGNKVSAAAWVAAGGSLTTEIHVDDPYTIVVTLRAPTSGVLATPDSKNTAAPYSIAMTDGTLYSRLFITGTGVRTEENTLTLSTGATGDLVQAGVGATLDNKHVGSLSQAYDVGIRMAQAYAGVRKSITRTYTDERMIPLNIGTRVADKSAYYRVTSITKTDDSSNDVLEPYTMFSDFNTKWAGKTFSDFNTEWGDLRMQDFAVAPLRKL